MFRVQRPRPVDPDSAASDQRAAFGWRVHAAQEAWTGRLDGKAAIFVSLESALLAVLAVAYSDRGVPAGLTGWRALVVAGGTALSVGAVLAAGAAVIPRLGRPRRHRLDRRHNLIYFGHLRHWAPDDLAGRIAALTPADELRQLSVQLIELSQSNWVKHRRLQLAVALAAGGIAAMLVGLLWPA
jgi:hypothetical protein